MFLISTKELAEILDRAGVKVKLFADDIKVYVQIVSSHDSDRPQATVRVGLVNQLGTNIAVDTPLINAVF